jgi:hypothetical protein
MARDPRIPPADSATSLTAGRVCTHVPPFPTFFFFFQQRHPRSTFSQSIRFAIVSRSATLARQKSFIETLCCVPVPSVNVHEERKVGTVTPLILDSRKNRTTVGQAHAPFRPLTSILPLEIYWLVGAPLPQSLFYLIKHLIHSRLAVSNGLEERSLILVEML